MRIAIVETGAVGSGLGCGTIMEVEVGERAGALTRLRTGRVDEKTIRQVSEDTVGRFSLDGERQRLTLRVGVFRFGA